MHNFLGSQSLLSITNQETLLSSSMYGPSRRSFPRRLAKQGICSFFRPSLWTFYTKAMSAETLTIDCGTIKLPKLPATVLPQMLVQADRAHDFGLKGFIDLTHPPSPNRLRPLRYMFLQGWSLRWENLRSQGHHLA